MLIPEVIYKTSSTGFYSKGTLIAIIGLRDTNFIINMTPYVFQAYFCSNPSV